MIGVFIGHQRSENSPATTHNSLAKFYSFVIILVLLNTILLLLQFLMKILMMAKQVTFTFRTMKKDIFQHIIVMEATWIIRCHIRPNL